MADDNDDLPSIQDIVDEEGASPMMRCPCSGQYRAYLKPRPAMTHTLPPCQHFIDMDMADFMEWARKNGARRLDSEN